MKKLRKHFGTASSLRVQPTAQTAALCAAATTPKHQSPPPSYHATEEDATTMIRLLLCMLPALAVMPSAHVASAQSSAPAGTAGGMPVIDAANLVRLVIDVALQRARQRVLEEAGRKAFSHYRRVTQFVGADVFRTGSMRDVLTSRPPNHTPTPYEEVYRRGYAPGVPETTQNSLALARIDSLTLSHARELEVLQRGIEHLNSHIVELEREMARRLARRAPRWGNDAPNLQGDLDQLQAALMAKRAALAALHARGRRH